VDTAVRQHGRPGGSAHHGHVRAAHIAGASLGGAIGQWLGVHRPDRVLTLTAIMSGPFGHNAGPAWARALAGQTGPQTSPPPPTTTWPDGL
jgi:pimeloyl-ACP methyl ester carboxylesterase